MPKTKMSDAFLVCTFAAIAVLVLIVAVFTLNLKNDGVATGRGVGVIGSLAAQQNAGEEGAYFDAGHGFMYHVVGSEVRAVLAYTPSSYPLGFACGSNIVNGSSVNSPLVQGDILFATYPFGLDEANQVYPTWNRVTGEYRTVKALSEMNLDSATAQPLSVSAITGDVISVEKESCLTMTFASLIVIALFFAGFVVTYLFGRRVKRV